MKTAKPIALLLLAALLVFSLSGCFGASYGPPALVNTVSITLGETRDINIEYVAENVTVTVSDTSEELVVKEYINRNETRFFARVETHGGELTVRHGQRDGINGLRSYIEVTLPKSYAGDFSVEVASGNLVFTGKQNTLKDLDLTTMSGSVEAADFSAADVDLESMSGRIELSNIKATDVSATTASGSVDAKNVETVEISLESMSGRVTAENCIGKFDMESMSGSVKAINCAGGGNFNSTSGGVEVDLSSFDYDIDAESTSGSVALTLPRGSSFRFHAESMSGQITASFGSEMDIVSRGEFSGQVGSNPTLSVSAETTSGRVTASWR